VTVTQTTTGVTLDGYLTIVTVHESTEDRDEFRDKVLSPILDQLRPVQKVQAVRALLDQAPWAVRRVIGAINSGDTGRLLDFFPEGVRLLDDGKVLSGRAQVREFSDRELIGVKGYLDVRQVVWHENTATVAGPYHSQRFNGSVRFVFTVVADEITELSIERDREPAWLS